MGRKRKRTAHLLQYQHPEYEYDDYDDSSFDDVLEFTIGSIYCGFPEREAQEFDILNGHNPPTYKEITEAFNIIRPLLKILAERSAADERKKIPSNAIISVDGSWDHCRDAKLHVYDVICIQTKKIIIFNVLIRISSKRNGNTLVTPQAMEGLTFMNILPQLMENENIIELVKDGDLQVDSIIKDSGWKVIIRPDLNHLLIHFRTKFDDAVKPNGSMFRGICDKILKQLIYILYESTETKVKIQKIYDMKDYILTKPLLKFGRSKTKQIWKYANDVKAKKSLDKVINLCITIAKSFHRGHTTCLNESFHFVKAKFLPKNYNLGNTGDVRIYAAILQFNIGDAWLDQIYDLLNLPKTNLAHFKKYRSTAHAILRGLSEKDDYFTNKTKEEEKKRQDKMQLQADKSNHILIYNLNK